MARKRLDLPRQLQSSRYTESVLDFIPRLSPRYSAPRHLAPLAKLFERALTERVLAVVSMPPRHGKTETELHAMAWTLLREPAQQIAFIGYAARFAEKKSRKARSLAMKAGVQVSHDAASRQDWRTGVEDGGVWATSIGGQLTGEGFHLMVVDDPHKGREDAESATKREGVYDWFTDDAFTRLEPKTGSCIVTQTRWHPDDLAGRLIRDGWENVCLPAIDDRGAALWPERWPLDELLVKKEQLGEYGWASLYQGQPRPRGGALFRDVHFYDRLPTTGLRLAIGYDLAYTAKTHADYSVAVVMARHGRDYYVVDVRRLQVEAPIFQSTLKNLQSELRGVRTLGFIGGTERGVIQLMRRAGVNLEAVTATADKFVRAQPVAAAWNAGRVFLPRGPHDWVDPFVDEITSFTGVGDRHDDQVDALAGAFHALSSSNEGTSKIVQKVLEAAPRTRF